MANLVYSPAVPRLGRVPLHGLESAEPVLQRLPELLGERGWAQLVTFSPGDESGPHVLADLAEPLLAGTTTLRVNPGPVVFAEHRGG